jgi:hypothetical protein
VGSRQVFCILDRARCNCGCVLSVGPPPNQRMKLAGAAILVSRSMKVLQAAPAAYPYRSGRVFDPRGVGAICKGRLLPFPRGGTARADPPRRGLYGRLSYAGLLDTRPERRSSAARDFPCEAHAA